MTNDSGDGYIMIFGGQANGYKSRNSTGNYTWEFAGGKWTNITADSPLSPGTRFGAAIGYDTVTDNAVLFSGMSGTVNSLLRIDTWSFQHGSWQCLWYEVNFTEIGLPPLTSWNVTLTPSSGSPTTLTSTSDAIDFVEPNGSYSYSIAPVSGYRISSGSYVGYVTVFSAKVTVKWTQVTYSVTFAERGLPDLTSWTVTLTPTSGSPTTNNSTKGTIKFTVPNGTYSYSSASPGYSGSSGNLTVSGPMSGPVKVSFQSKSAAAKPSGLSHFDYVIIGVAVLAVAIGLVVMLSRRRDKPPPAPASSPSAAGNDTPLTPP
jgi:hypothetical protein